MKKRSQQAHHPAPPRLQRQRSTAAPANRTHRSHSMCADRSRRGSSSSQRQRLATLSRSASAPRESKNAMRRLIFRIVFSPFLSHGAYRKQEPEALPPVRPAMSTFSGSNFQPRTSHQGCNCPSNPTATRSRSDTCRASRAELSGRRDRWRPPSPPSHRMPRR